jgi:hypothetical protein
VGSLLHSMAVLPPPPPERPGNHYTGSRVVPEDCLDGTENLVPIMIRFPEHSVYSRSLN